MQRGLQLLVLSFFVVSCGTDDMSFLLGQSKGGAKRSPITEVSGFQTIGDTRIANPKTPEDFAINEIQDFNDVHQRFRNHLANQNVVLPEVMNRYDVVTPLIYSPKRVLEAVNLIKQNMPKDLLLIYQKKDHFPGTNSFDIKVLMQWHKVIMNATEQAKRWQQLIAPQVKYWKEFYKKDVRGYVFFREMEQLDSKLLKFTEQDTAFQEKAKSSMIQICLNNGSSFESCSAETKEKNFPDRIFSLYYRYKDKAKENFDSFFKIQKKVSHLVWLDNHAVTFNLRSQTSSDLTLMFDNLIEANWKNNDFKLILTFAKEPSPDLATLSIGKHAIGHVINHKNLYLPTMDLILPDRQKVAIHEMGHLLGFGDCYVEFVDQQTGDAVYYELSDTNIMCSLAGQVQEHHFKELKKTYD